MHIEILVEDSSGKELLTQLAPQLLGPYSDPHTWRCHEYKGIGRIPPDLAGKTDPNKRILLDQLPRLLRGFAKTPGIDAVVVVVDTDNRNCCAFLDELKELAYICSPSRTVMFRFAIEEIEAWYLGDRAAIDRAYPSAKRKVLERPPR